MNVTAEQSAEWDYALMEAIEAYWHEHGYAPCVRDLADGHANSAVLRHLRRLREGGFVLFEDKRNRTVRLAPEHLEAFEAARERRTDTNVATDKW